MLTGGQLAALIVAVFWAILVCFLSLALVRLSRVLTETTKLLSGVTDRAVPLLEEATTTVTRASGQLERVDGIARDVESITSNASKLTMLVTAVFGTPLARLAGLSYGIRRAFGRSGRTELRQQARADMRAARKRGIRGESTFREAVGPGREGSAKYRRTRQGVDS